MTKVLCHFPYWFIDCSKSMRGLAREGRQAQRSTRESLNMTTSDEAQQTTHGRPGRRNRERSYGQSMVEFAMVLPLMLFMLLIAADFGRAYTAYLTVSSAAREGAVYASRSSDNATDTAEIQNRVRDEVGSSGEIWGEPLSVSVSSGDDPQGYEWVAVTVDYTFMPLFTVPPIPDSIDMERTVRMRVLGN